MKPIYFIFLFLLFGCKDENVFNEADYDKKQGLVTETKIVYKAFRIKEYHIHYKVFMDSTLTLSKKYLEGDFITNENQPIVVYINKKDSTDYFIAHKGIIDNDLLFNYLKKEKVPYYIKNTKRINLKH
ncbi:hypothetical protein M0M57_15030 [Flavobacterium azooxidireducens]|uniref:Lipoprotein n=1 Tax=Flavobacterium azooxidireducens TaxID=1871076 RepID=A0ABY4KDQ1_9FLAO|nr:hypothetical protein [Flavobacterium azooxidireducens]UPQ78920.1 hypothetical protein M0M57_15030 [Flavobacterium azooxidireducens]